MLVEAGVISKARDGVRILGKGELKAKVELHAAGASKSAVEAVEKAGGKIVLPAPSSE
jgi:large subunit ribosomal protein L15